MSQNVAIEKSPAKELNEEPHVKEVNVLVTNGKAFHRMTIVEVPRVCTEIDILGKVFPSCNISYDGKGFKLLHDKTEIRAEVMAVYNCKISFQYIIETKVMKGNEDGDRQFEKMDVEESVQGIAPSKCSTSDRETQNISSPKQKTSQLSDGSAEPEKENLLPHGIDNDVEFVCEIVQVPKSPGGNEISLAVNELIGEESSKEIRVLLRYNNIDVRIYTMDVPIHCKDSDLIDTIFSGSKIFAGKNGFTIVNGNTEQRAEVVLVDNPKWTHQYEIHLLTIK